MKATIAEGITDGGYATNFEIRIYVGEAVCLDGKKYEEDVKALKAKTERVYAEVKKLLESMED